MRRNLCFRRFSCNLSGKGVKYRQLKIGSSKGIIVGLFKKIFMPSNKKILIFIIVAFVLSQLQPLGYKKDESFNVNGKKWEITNNFVPKGFPVPWLSRSEWGSSVAYTGLFIDLFFWYFFSCLVIFAWDKIRNKNR